MYISNDSNLFYEAVEYAFSFIFDSAATTKSELASLTSNGDRYKKRYD